MATDLLPIRAYWARPTAITSADQPLAPILGMLRYLRSNQWMVLYRERGSEITGYFPLKKAEIQERTRGANPILLASELLELPREGAAPVERRTSNLEPQRGPFPERQRPVLLDESGAVIGIGVARHDITRTARRALRHVDEEWPEIRYHAERMLAPTKKSDVQIHHVRSDFAPEPKLRRSETHQPIARTAPPEADEPPLELDETIIPVFFGTDRQATETRQGDLKFSGERSKRGEVTLGICSVSIPPMHRLGKLERPAWWKFWTSARRGEHVVLLSTTSLGAATFFKELKKAVHQPKSAFVFIHGYNVAFDTAAMRTAQLALDLQFPGAPIMFSWPSKGGVANYPSDEGSNEWARPHLKQFLNQLRNRADADQIHLIAHSMGSRALLSVLQELSGGPKFEQLILAAPDVDAGIFRQLALQLPALSNRVTLYASSTDKALALSKRIHEYARAGEAGENILVLKGLDTIDASTVDTDFLGHSTFAQERTLLTDIFNLITHGHEPASRFGLTRKPHNGGYYWSFRS